MIRTGSLVLPALQVPSTPPHPVFPSSNCRSSQVSGFGSEFTAHLQVPPFCFSFFFLLICCVFLLYSFPFFFFLFLFLILFRYSFPTVVQVPKVFLWMFFSFYLFFLSFLFSFRVAFYFPFLFSSFYISPFIFSLSCHHVDIVSLGYILYILS